MVKEKPKTLLIIPPECQIGGNLMRVRHNEQAMRIAELRGQMSIPEGIIRLSFIYDNKPRTTPQLLESFIHEIIHAIDLLYIRELEERQVGALASGITQALLSIGIEPDFSQIPEEE